MKNQWIEVQRDYEPENPREFFDGHLDTIYCFPHRHLNISDKGALSPNDIEGFHDDYLWKPFYCYAHSGVTISLNPFSCEWDSWMAGFIYISKEKALAELGKQEMTPELEKKVHAWFAASIKQMDQYLTGDVWGYECFEQLAEEEPRAVDSCWQFFGREELMRHLQEEFEGVEIREIDS